MKTSRLVSSAALALLLSGGLVCAQTATYNFDSPQWVNGASTPFYNMPPDLAPGLPGFTASFTASQPMIITTFAGNPSFTGQSLVQPAPPYAGATLTIALSRPITALSLDFIQFVPGHFDLTSTAGTTSISVGVPAYGSLTFHSATGFTSFALTAFDSAGSPIPMGIDNLIMAVPEPSAFALAGLGAVALLLRRR